MPRITAVQAAVRVLEREGVTVAFGVPGAAINPFYAAMREHGKIRHILARHVEGASHMADGYSRAVPGNIGVCIGTSGPAATRAGCSRCCTAAPSLAGCTSIAVRCRSPTCRGSERKAATIMGEHIKPSHPDQVQDIVRWAVAGSW